MSAEAVPVLAVDGLEVEFATRAGTVRAVRGASYAVAVGARSPWWASPAAASR